MDKELIKAMRNAIKQDDLAAVKQLLKENPDLLEAQTPFGTWLHEAAIQGKYAIAEYFIKSGIDVNTCAGIFKAGAIKEAAFEGRLNILKLLHENGAILDAGTFEANPLFSAIYNNHFDVAKYLIDNGIDLKAAYAIGELDNCDALEYARQYGRTEIADYIKEKLKETK